MGIQIPHAKGQFSWAEDAASYKVQGLSAVRCAKMAETIQMLFGITRVSPWKHVLDRVHNGTTW